GRCRRGGEPAARPAVRDAAPPAATADRRAGRGRDPRHRGTGPARARAAAARRRGGGTAAGLPGAGRRGVLQPPATVAVPGAGGRDPRRGAGARGGADRRGGAGAVRLDPRPRRLISFPTTTTPPAGRGRPAPPTGTGRSCAAGARPAAPRTGTRR